MTQTPHIGCPLCRLYKNREITTKLYYEDDLVIIVDCKTCKNTPMIVIKQHVGWPSTEDLLRVFLRFKNILRGYNIHGGYFDYKMRSIPSHFHIHYRR